MFPAFLILFREILEMSLILGIVMAATRGIASRNRWVILGVTGGLLGSAAVALFADQISQALEGMGQEVFNAVVLGLAAVMIAWTVVWMQQHGRELAAKIKQVGKAVTEGDMPLYSIAILVSLSMWREGSEVVLFMYGILSTTKESFLSVMTGAAAGTLLASVIGMMLYFGLVKLPSKYFFSVTGWLLVFLACGMASQAAHFLVAADMLPAVVPSMWDSSWLLSEQTLLGKIMHSLVGYSSNPSGMEVIVYFSTFVMIMVLLTFARHKTLLVSFRRRHVVTVIVLFAAATYLVSAKPASAGFYLYDPYVEEGMFEIEYKARYDADHRASEDGFNEHKFAIGYGVTSWWKTELYGELKQNPNAALRFEATEWENIFQLTHQGEYWVDVGLLTAYEFAYESSDPDKVEMGLLLAKDIDRFHNLLNLKWEKEVGPNSGAKPELEVGFGTRYMLNPHFNPGIEYIGEFGEISNTHSYSDQKHRLGPVAYGDIGYGFSYEAGYLAGISHSAEDHLFKLLLEYEFPL